MTAAIYIKKEGDTFIVWSNREGVMQYAKGPEAALRAAMGMVGTELFHHTAYSWGCSDEEIQQVREAHHKMVKEIK